MRYLFYPGCSLESTARSYLMSTQAVAEALGVELQEIPDWTCCGSTPAHSTNEELALTLPARNLILAQEAGEVVVCCASCYGRLAYTAKALGENANLRAQVGQALGLEYKGNVRVRHLLQILAEDIGLSEIGSAVVKPLENLRVACYYGCLLTRPREISIADDPENPTIMDKVLEATGAPTVEWPYKTDCCGANLSITRPSTVKRLVGEILKGAKESGANCIAVACPLCQINLDLRQEDLAGRFDLPVFYFTQLLGVAFGIPDKSLGISKLMVDPRKVLTKSD